MGKSESPPSGQHSPGDGHDHGHGSSVPGLNWKTPAGWEQMPPGQMRAASFRVKGDGNAFADVSVIPLPGLAGSDLDNVNRWRGQAGLAPVKDDGLEGLAQEVDVAGSKARLYDLAGENVGAGEKTRILGVILRKDGTAWFFKMTGPDALVAGQKSAFREFLKGVEFTEGPGMSGQMAGTTGNVELPPSHPPIGGVMTNMSLPPSHPPIGGMTNLGLPPSHPPIGGATK